MDTILRKINIFSTFTIVVFGLIGHFFTILVYSRKKFRTNSAHVHLLCLAIIDSIFLLIHLFEDTLRTFNDVYFNSNNNSTAMINIKNIIQTINLTDKNDTACKTINYLRYTLRLISAYTIVGFTIQRYFIIKSPLESRLNTKKASWSTFIIISIVSLVLNLWVPFLFKIQENKNYCDINKNYRNSYFTIGIIFIITCIMIPIIIIFGFNILIIRATKAADIKRTKLQASMSKRNISTTLKTSLNLNKTNSSKLTNFDINSAKQSRASVNSQIMVYYSNLDNFSNKIKCKTTNTKKITQMLLFLSFSYAFLNLPYFIIWLCFFTRVAFQKYDDMQIFEIFNVLHYAIYFYVNWASSGMFRSQLKNLCKIRILEILVKYRF